MIVKSHLIRDFEKMKKDLLTLGAMVEEATNKAIVALTSRRADLVDEVIDGDPIVDEQELEVEDSCLKILALHQPVAGDLRYIVAAIKVNSYLERMGDLAVNIAQRAKYLAHREPIPTPVDFTKMAEIVRGMVCDSLNALINRDADLAKEVMKRDDEVDRIHKGMFDILETTIAENPDMTKRAIQTLSASYNLERIADLSVNICEDVIFVISGEVIRHQGL